MRKVIATSIYGIQINRVIDQISDMLGASSEPWQFQFSFKLISTFIEYHDQQAVQNLAKDYNGALHQQAALYPTDFENTPYFRLEEEGRYIGTQKVSDRFFQSKTLETMIQTARGIVSQEELNASINDVATHDFTSDNVVLEYKKISNKLKRDLLIRGHRAGMLLNENLEHFLDRKRSSIQQTIHHSFYYLMGNSSVTDTLKTSVTSRMNELSDALSHVALAVKIIEDFGQTFRSSELVNLFSKVPIHYPSEKSVIEYESNFESSDKTKGSFSELLRLRDQVNTVEEGVFTPMFDYTVKLWGGFLDIFRDIVSGNHPDEVVRSDFQMIDREVRNIMNGLKFLSRVTDHPSEYENTNSFVQMVGALSMPGFLNFTQFVFLHSEQFSWSEAEIPDSMLDVSSVMFLKLRRHLETCSVLVSDLSSWSHQLREGQPGNSVFLGTHGWLNALPNEDRDLFFLSHLEVLKNRFQASRDVLNSNFEGGFLGVQENESKGQLDIFYGLKMIEHLNNDLFTSYWKMSTEEEQHYFMEGKFDQAKSVIQNRVALSSENSYIIAQLEEHEQILKDIVTLIETIVLASPVLTEQFQDFEDKIQTIEQPYFDSMIMNTEEDSSDLNRELCIQSLKKYIKGWKLYFSDIFYTRLS